MPHCSAISANRLDQISETAVRVGIAVTTNASLHNFPHPDRTGPVHRPSASYLAPPGRRAAIGRKATVGLHWREGALPHLSARACAGAFNGSPKGCGADDSPLGALSRNSPSEVISYVIAVPKEDA